MRNKTVLLAGIAAAAIVGFAGLAQAQDPAFHTMTVQLPGGGIETIRYTGSVAPKIAVAPADAPMAIGFMPTFAAFDQIAAQMDRQMAAMQRQMMMPMMGMPDMNQLMQAAARNGGGSFCAQSVSITSMGNGQPAKVVRHTAGNCGSAAMSNDGNQANDVEAVPGAAKPIPIKTTAPAPHPARQHI